MNCSSKNDIKSTKQTSQIQYNNKQDRQNDVVLCIYIYMVACMKEVFMYDRSRKIVNKHRYVYSIGIDEKIWIFNNRQYKYVSNMDCSCCSKSLCPPPPPPLLLIAWEYWPSNNRYHYRYPLHYRSRYPNRSDSHSHRCFRYYSSYYYCC